jgi:GH43 family beta-xylosidase
MNDVWAPELHDVGGTWYVYFAADQPPKGNPGHRMYVLRGPASSIDPMEPTSTFSLVGLVGNLPPNQWAIDGTVFTIDNQLYLAYSGWPATETDGNTQQLFIAKMTNPVTADPAGVHMISTPTFPWESYQDPGSNGALHKINEGPAWLEVDAFKGIVFSAGASWTSDYQLGILQYLGGDPLQISSWKKYPQQLLSNNPDGAGPYGPGHCSYYSREFGSDGRFVPSPDNTQIWIIYHATPNLGDGWNNRKGRCQLLIDRSGLPYSDLYPLLPGTVVPSGTIIPTQQTQAVMGGNVSKVVNNKNIWQTVKAKLKIQKQSS